MKRKFRGRSITTKLLLVNTLILCIFGGIIIVVLTSFFDIETSLTKIVDRDVSQVIENAQLGRDLTRVFANTKSVIDEYTENEEMLKKEGDNLIATVNDLAAQSSDTQLQDALQVFVQKLQLLLDQSANIGQILKTAHTLDQDFANGLKGVEEIISEKLITVMIEGGDPSLIEQLNFMMPGYRETTLQIAVEFAKMRQEHSMTGESAEQIFAMTAEEHHPILFSLLNDLSTRFQALSASEPKVIEYGKQLINTIQKYKDTVTLFHQSLTQFQIHLNEMNDARDQVLTIMKDIDEDIEQATGRIQREIAETIGDSRRMIFILSAIFIGVLSLAWLGMRWMTKPLENLSQCAAQLAEGDIECDVLDIKSRDEIGTLSRAFRNLITYFQEMARTVTEISRGNLELEVNAKSKKDMLGNGFQRMIVYLKDMGEFATHAAQGDLRSQITLRSQTDQLGNAFIHMQEGLIALISEIRSGSDHIASISSQVLSTSSKNSEALAHIGNAAEVTSSAMREVSSSAEEVRMNTEHLGSSVEETSASISQMISSIKHVAENSRKLSGFADDTRVTMTNIVNSLEKVADQAEHSQMLAETTTHDAVSGQKSVEQMITRITAISEVTKDISKIVSHLEERSMEIGTILDVINEVAEQTSLLSLNASIIAAQAGVHGRGFAVVADEIKELASRVGTSTKEISKIIESVQRDSSNAVSTLAKGQREVEDGVAIAHKAGEALKKIGQSAENSSDVAAEIAVLVREQTNASTHVAESIQDVTNMINEITRATQEQEKNSSQLFNIVEKMQALATQVARATQEQQQSTLHVTEFMEDVIKLVNENSPTVSELAQSANELAAQADVLKKQVERFVLPEREIQALTKRGDVESLEVLE
jgi:methyl-accepting chemotaxis protein